MSLFGVSLRLCVSGSLVFIFCCAFSLGLVSLPLITQLSGKPLLLIHSFYVNSLSVQLYVLKGPTVVLMTQSGTASTTPGGKNDWDIFI